MIFLLKCNFSFLIDSTTRKCDSMALSEVFVKFIVQKMSLMRKKAKKKSTTNHFDVNFFFLRFFRSGLLFYDRNMKSKNHGITFFSRMKNEGNFRRRATGDLEKLSTCWNGERFRRKYRNWIFNKIKRSFVESFQTRVIRNKTSTISILYQLDDGERIIIVFLFSSNNTNKIFNSLVNHRMRFH